MESFWSVRRIRDNSRTTRTDLGFGKSAHSFSHLSKTLSACFSIRQLSDNFSSMDGSWNWVCSIFANWINFHELTEIPESVPNIVILSLPELMFFLAFLRYNNAFAGVGNFIIKNFSKKNYKLESHTRKKTPDIFRQGLSQKPAVVCSIHFS